MLEKQVDNLFTVESLNLYIQNLFSQDSILKNLSVKGELSNVKKYPSGHIYFTLKDKKSRISSVMYKFNSYNLDFELKEGNEVVVNGDIKVYVKNGVYQLYARKIEKAGFGDLYKKFELLKEKLKKEGLFEEKHKKSIPVFPKKVGLICGKNSAAYHDVVKTIENRCPFIKIVYYPSLVQGDNAHLQIIEKLKSLEKENVDVIILTRGGGSFEDLFEFNSEDLARTIFSLKTPIITAIGHESDFTIAEFVSDKRGSTPTSLAQMISPSIEDIKKKILLLNKNLNKSLENRLENLKMNLAMLDKEIDRDKFFRYLQLKEDKLNSIKRMFNIYKIEFIKTKKELVENKLEKTNYFLFSIIENKKNKLKSLKEALYLLSPENMFKRGYSLVKFEDKVIRELKDIEIDDVVDIRIKDGVLKGKIIEKRGEKDE